MYYILKFKWFEYQLESLSIFIKFVIVALPFILVSCYIIYFSQDSKPTQSFELEKLKKEISELKTLEVQTINFLEVIQSVEAFSLSNAIHIKSLKENNKSLELKFMTDKEGLSLLIEFSEWFHMASKIASLKFKENKGKFEGEITLSFKNFFKKEKLLSVKHIKPPSSLTLKLSAIIGSYVLINGQLLTLNDKIGLYKIVKIEKNRVILEYKSKRVVLELYEKIN